MKITKSWTMRLNAISAVAVILQQVLDVHIIPEEYALYVLLVVNILNAAIRVFKTSQSIE